MMAYHERGYIYCMLLPVPCMSFPPIGQGSRNHQETLTWSVIGYWIRQLGIYIWHRLRCHRIWYMEYIVKRFDFLEYTTLLELETSSVSPHKACLKIRRQRGLWDGDEEPLLFFPWPIIYSSVMVLDCGNYTGTPMNTCTQLISMSTSERLNWLISKLTHIIYH